MKNLMMKRVLDAAILMTLLGILSQSASASIQIPAPDAGSTSMLLAIACAGLTAVRRFKR
jgi:hypothetical protein